MHYIIETVRSRVRVIYGTLFLLATAVIGRAAATAGPDTASLPKAVVGYLAIVAIALVAGLAFFNAIRGMRSPRVKVFAFYIIAITAGLLATFVGSLLASGYSNSSFFFFFALGLYIPLVMHTSRLEG